MSETDNNLETNMTSKAAAEYHQGAAGSVFHGIRGCGVQRSSWLPAQVDEERGWTKAIENPTQQ
jgi:hypothetical protein